MTYMTNSHRIKKAVLLPTAALGVLHLINHSVLRSAVSKDILKEEQGKCFTWNIGSVYYRTFGSGRKPLLLLHDAASFSSGYDWNQLIADLSREYRIFVPDLPGCGRSEKPNITYTNYLYAQFICDFISSVIKSPASVGASGLTGSFVVCAAALRPDLISKITMINPVRPETLLHTPQERRGVRTLLQIPVIGTCIYNIVNSRSNIEYRLTEKYLFNPFKLQKRTVDACYEAAHLKNGNGRYFMASLDGNYLNWDIRRIFSGIKIPVTIVYGDRLAQEKKIAEAYRKLNPQVTLVPMKNTKLLPQLEKSKLFSSLF